MSSQLTPEDALALWREVLVARVSSDEPDLTERQMAIFLTVYVNDPPHTVRGLAALLRISKPAVTRALDTLGRLGYVQRKRDDADRRNVLVQRTEKGRDFLAAFGTQISAIIQTRIA
ncbi:MAG TPA: MarR family transcriptional regulator [Rhizomicrobium sp.]|nr:MarR family transcriptional regulator [Rhizomicrobium sp.]